MDLPKEPTISQPYLTAHDGETPTDQDSLWQHIMSSYGTMPEREDLRFRPLKGAEPGVWCSFNGATMEIGDAPDDSLLGLSIVTYTLESAPHPVTKMPTEVRRQKIGKSFAGEPIFALKRVSAWEFFTTHEPDPAQMSRSEWENFLTQYKGRIEHDRAAAERVNAANAERGARAEAAAKARECPEEFIARAIASGVAQCLVAMKEGK